jgi:hypothetical protein
MIYISHKLQAKRITTRTWWSSTDITNIQKKLLRVQVSLLSHYLQLLKIISTRTPASSLESLFFFIIKSNKQQAGSQQAAVSLFFFIIKSNKHQAAQQQAPSLTLDNYSGIL